MFADRADAGRQLAERVAALQLHDPIVLALPRGGVPVAAEIARWLTAPLDVVFVRKIGAPGQPELAIGAIANGSDPEIVLNKKLIVKLGLCETFIAAEAARGFDAIEQRRRDYAAVRPGLDPSGRTAVIVDDGAATGMTMQAVLRHLRRRSSSALVAAVPVASRDAIAMLRQEADEVVCLANPRRFGSVGAFYRCFTQVTDEAVTALLKEAAQRQSTR